jgi:hypothetical protein
MHAFNSISIRFWLSSLIDVSILWKLEAHDEYSKNTYFNCKNFPWLGMYHFIDNSVRASAQLADFLQTQRSNYVFLAIRIPKKILNKHN